MAATSDVETPTSHATPDQTSRCFSQLSVRFKKFIGDKKRLKFWAARAPNPHKKDNIAFPLEVLSLESENVSVEVNPAAEVVLENCTVPNCRRYSLYFKTNGTHTITVHSGNEQLQKQLDVVWKRPGLEITTESEFFEDESHENSGIESTPGSSPLPQVPINEPERQYQIVDCTDNFLPGVYDQGNPIIIARTAAFKRENVESAMILWSQLTHGTLVRNVHFDTISASVLLSLSNKFSSDLDNSSQEFLKLLCDDMVYSLASNTEISLDAYLGMANENKGIYTHCILLEQMMNGCSDLRRLFKNGFLLHIAKSDIASMIPDDKTVLLRFTLSKSTPQSISCHWMQAGVEKQRVVAFAELEKRNESFVTWFNETFPEYFEKVVQKADDGRYQVVSRELLERYK